MTPQIKQAMLVVIYYLDSEMEKHPDRATADAVNFLQELYDNNETKSEIKRIIDEGMDQERV